MVHLFHFKTHIQNPINNTFTLSYTFQSLKRLFILVFISSRISSLARLAFSELLSSYAPGCCLSFARCATLSSLAHQIVVSCFAFSTFTFFLRFRIKTTSDKSTLYIHGRSILSRIFITVRLFLRRNFSLESQFILLRGLFLWQFIFIFSPFLSPSLSHSLTLFLLFLCLL
jgi:hypothetical protein